VKIDATERERERERERETCAWVTRETAPGKSIFRVFQDEDPSAAT